jgi:hypothetical protein
MQILINNSSSNQSYYIALMIKMGVEKLKKNRTEQREFIQMYILYIYLYINMNKFQVFKKYNQLNISCKHILYINNYIL